MRRSRPLSHRRQISAKRPSPSASATAAENIARRRRRRHRRQRRRALKRAYEHVVELQKRLAAIAKRVRDRADAPHALVHRALADYAASPLGSKVHERAHAPPPLERYRAHLVELDAVSARRTGGSFVDELCARACDPALSVFNAHSAIEHHTLLAPLFDAPLPRFVPTPIADTLSAQELELRCAFIDRLDAARGLHLDDRAALRQVLADAMRALHDAQKDLNHRGDDNDDDDDDDDDESSSDDDDEDESSSSADYEDDYDGERRETALVASFHLIIERTTEKAMTLHRAFVAGTIDALQAFTVNQRST